MKIIHVITRSILFFILIIQNTFSQQFKNSNVLSLEKADSVVISKMYYRDKEFSAPLASNFVLAKKDSITEAITLPYYKAERDTIHVLSAKKLTSNEVSKLNGILQSKSSLSNKGVALQNHYDFEINYYKKGAVFQYVRVSTFTDKITINRLGCESTRDKDGEEIDPCLFYGSVTKTFKIKLKSLFD